jgi:hypothetical protein
MEDGDEEGEVNRALEGGHVSESRLIACTYTGMSPCSHSIPRRKASKIKLMNIVYLFKLIMYSFTT